MRQLSILFFLHFSIISFSKAQEISNKKFGEVKISDFRPAAYAPDSQASAIILAETGNSKIIGNGTAFSMNYYVHKRLRIMDKSGFDHATIEIRLLKSESDVEKLTELNAVVYNLENGLVTKTLVDNESVFTDKINDNYTVKKFTFPNIKEGSIIEYEYTIKSPFYFIPRPWYFQDYIPKLYSEYYITFPKEYIELATTKYGFLSYETDTSYNLKKGEMDNIDNGNNDGKSSRSSKFFIGYWIMKDIPALKHENLISSLKNYRSRIEFTAQNVTVPGSSDNTFKSDWYRIIRGLTWTKSFGGVSQDDSLWLIDHIRKSITNTSDDHQRAKNIYAYIRDNFTCLGNSSLLMTKPLRKIVEDKSGAISDLNLLLTASLRAMFFNAVPVLLSTRSHGMINTTYPQLDDYNYVICRLKIGDEYINLDASQKMLGFGQLGNELYNGPAFITNPMQFADETDISPAMFSNLSPDSLKEVKTTNVFIINEDKNAISGNLAVQFGAQESLGIKEKLSKMKQDDFFNAVKKSFNGEPSLDKIEIDSLNIPGEPLSVKFDFKTALNDEDLIYFGPFISTDKIENPLKSAERMFPIELPYCKDEMYVLNMEIPEGYTIDEIPKSTKLMLNDNEGSFEYLIGQAGNRIMLKCRLQLNRTVFDAKDYTVIRDFFTTVIRKENEQIVFKKVD